ncbi:MAG: hypothetical protein ABIG42_04840 [bacterium]
MAEEAGYKRPVIVGNDGARHRTQPRRLNVTNFSSLRKEIGEEGASIRIDNIADTRLMDAEPERTVVTESMMDDIRSVIDGLEGLDVEYKGLIKLHLLEGKSIRACKELLRLKEPESRLRSIIASSVLKMRKRLKTLGYDRKILRQT